MNRVAIICLALSVLARVGRAQSPTIDGVLDADFYGAARSVQDTPTSFGDATNGHIRFARGGSELDAAYARISDGTLFLFIAGNVETAGQGIQWPVGNRNKLDIFIDSIEGGQSSLRGDNADVDGNGLNRMGHLDPSNDGLKFDTGVAHDFFLTFNNYTEVVFIPGSGNQELWRGQLYYASLPTGGSGTGTLVGTASDSWPGSYPDSFTLSQGVRMGFRNSNTNGVTGTGAPSPSAADAPNVTSGLELAIPLALIDSTNGDLNAEIRITAFINDSAHGYLSNQVLGPMGQPSGSYGNLAEPRVFDFSQSYSPGAQYFTADNAYPSTRLILPVTLLDTGSISNRWIGEVGATYVLQYTTNLLTGPWTNVSGVVTAESPLVSFVDTNSAASRMYYRTARLP
ncbi:MAG TPA: hypothetical protein P5567_10450 [Kiritimatiellia bacterium]|nr:hypothetical protein [Kiritimatiellia bacterium]HRZ12859.1 hypothetical protein [Kiritimatiellia bacterium]HSA18189.1 hypothetical protein [Kiritimatiellia bacterium]